MKHSRVAVIISVPLFLLFMLFSISPATSVEIDDSPCKADCTTFDNICHEECDGVNGCVYNDTYYSAEWRFIKQVCNLQKKGWVKIFNATHDIICCNNTPHQRVSKRFSIETKQGLDEIATVSRYINLNGKMVTMYISVWK